MLERVVDGASTIQNPEIDGCKCTTNGVESTVGVRVTGPWSQGNGRSGRLDWSPRYLMMMEHLHLRRRVLYGVDGCRTGFMGPAGMNVYLRGGSQSRQTELAHCLQESSLQSLSTIAEICLQTERLSKFLRGKHRRAHQQLRSPSPWSPQSCRVQSPRYPSSLPLFRISCPCPCPSLFPQAPFRSSSSSLHSAFKTSQAASAVPKSVVAAPAAPYRA